MGGFESAAINKPLIFTGALKTGAAKRLVKNYGVLEENRWVGHPCR
jgi:hypothetical protein